ncbi:MAG: nitroreductase family protein [Exilispira sp.]
MSLDQIINSRRAYRAIEKIQISQNIIKSLAESASLAPSCYNNQPWKFVFVVSNEKLENLSEAYSKGNEWCQNASMVIVVISRKEDDCIIGERTYYQFDTGMAIAFLILKATELGLVAHPIAGFNPDKIKQIIQLPEDYEVITLIIVGKKSDNLSILTKPWQIESEKTRPLRKQLNEFCYIDNFLNNISL